MKIQIKILIFIAVLLVTCFIFHNINAQDFKTVKIGEQVWMAENLNIHYYRNGDPIPEAKTNEEWEQYNKENKGCWCYYNYDSANGKKYGRLYNWLAVNDSRGLAPTGWHIPSLLELTNLINFSGGSKLAGVTLKDTSFQCNNSFGATNLYGFSVLGGGILSKKDFFKFEGIDYKAYFWSTNGGSDFATCIMFTCESLSTGGFIFSQFYGLSLRCIKD